MKLSTYQKKNDHVRNDTVFFYHYHTKQITDINYSLKFQFRIKPQPECVLNEHGSGGFFSSNFRPSFQSNFKFLQNVLSLKSHNTA